MDISKSIYDNFAETAERRGNHPAVFYLGSRYSYARIRTLADRLASALTDMGVTAGQKVMLYIPNSIQWVVCWLGIQKIGAVCVPITPIYTPHDLDYIAGDSEAETIICADTNFGYVTSVLASTGLKRVIVSNTAD
jgi:long-chain acyl-CoA synthetase